MGEVVVPPAEHIDGATDDHAGGDRPCQGIQCGHAGQPLTIELVQACPHRDGQASQDQHAEPAHRQRSDADEDGVEGDRHGCQCGMAGVTWGVTWGVTRRSF